MLNSRFSKIQNNEKLTQNKTNKKLISLKYFAVPRPVIPGRLSGTSLFLRVPKKKEFEFLAEEVR